jgi:hypothetical protein
VLGATHAEERVKTRGGSLRMCFTQDRPQRVGVGEACRWHSLSERVMHPPYEIDIDLTENLIQTSPLHI